MKIIGHLDLDAFFASVEEVSKPHLKGKPIAVGADPADGHGRGVISTANYKARAYGLHSAMPVSKAWQLSEQARQKGLESVTFLLGNHKLYGQVSARVAEMIRSRVPNVEQASIDEFYFELSFTGSFAAAKKLCVAIQKDIFKREGITCSIGIAPNRFVAKIAAGFKKPNGLHVVLPKQVEAFLAPMGIRELPGIGSKTAQIFYDRNITTIAQLRELSPETLKQLIGKHGAGIYYMARGIGSAEILQERHVKSMGEQVTFMRDTLAAADIFAEFAKLCEGVFASFTASEFVRFKTITVTVRFADFVTKTSSHTLAESITKSARLIGGSNAKKKFETEAIKLLLPFLDKRQNPQLKPLRLLGVRIEKLG